MLEIIALVFICKTLGTRMRAKAWNPLALQFLQVIGWFGGELVGAIVMVIVCAIINPEQPPSMGMIYVGAILGGLASVALCFTIVTLLPDRSAEMTMGITGFPRSSAVNPLVVAGTPTAIATSENPYAVFSAAPVTGHASQTSSNTDARTWPPDSRFTAASGYGPLRPFTPAELASSAYYKARVNRLSFANINRFTGNVFLRVVLYVTRMFRLPLPADNYSTVTDQIVEIEHDSVRPIVMQSLRSVIVESMNGPCSEDVLLTTIPTLGMHDVHHYSAPAADSAGFLLAVFHRAKMGVETTILDIGVFAKINDDQWIGVKRRTTQGIIFGSHIKSRRVSPSMPLGRMFEELKKDLGKYAARPAPVNGANLKSLVKQMSWLSDQEMIKAGVLVPLPKAKVEQMLAEAKE